MKAQLIDLTHWSHNAQAETGAGYVFNVISNALQEETIAALCRIWDKSADAAHVGKIADRLKKHPDAVSDAAGLAKWLKDVEEMKTFEPLVTLRDTAASGYPTGQIQLSQIRAATRSGVAGLLFTAMSVRLWSGGRSD